MSRKNHEMIDEKLLQTDKKYSQLKLKQKEKIADWMFQATRDYYTKKYVFPNEKHLEEESTAPRTGACTVSPTAAAYTPRRTATVKNLNAVNKRRPKTDFYRII